MQTGMHPRAFHLGERNSFGHRGDMHLYSGKEREKVHTWHPPALRPRHVPILNSPCSLYHTGTIIRLGVCYRRFTWTIEKMGLMPPKCVCRMGWQWDSSSSCASAVCCFCQHRLGGKLLWAHKFIDYGYVPKKEEVHWWTMYLRLWRIEGWIRVKRKK